MLFRNCLLKIIILFTSMFKIYHTNSLNIQEKYSLAELLMNMPVAVKERALRYKFEADAYQLVVGRLLLKYGLKEMGMVNRLAQITYNENDKPKLENVSFNISHSGDMVVCVLSDDGQIGIDIEQYKQLNLSDFEAFFTPKEWGSINKAPLPLEKFFWYWTRKESIIKSMGVNLSYLHQIEIDASQNYFSNEGQIWFLQDFDVLPGYYGAICSDSKRQWKNISVSPSLICK